MATALRAGVVGTGFVGVVHVHALRLLGVEIAGVVIAFALARLAGDFPGMLGGIAMVALLRAAGA